MIDPKILAGITDSNFEFFEKNGEIFFIQNQKENSFSQVGIDYLYMIREDLEQHPRALKAMVFCGISDWYEQLKRWAICNFGNFDNRADLTTDGVIVHEHVRCASRGKCEFEGIICLPVNAPNGSITPRELEIIKMICQDLPDKIIADRLNISIHTMCIHRSNIEKKIGCHSKAGIVSFSYENHLI